MRIEHDSTDPDTMPHRQQRWLAKWRFYHTMGLACRDAHPGDRARLNAAQEIAREHARAWIDERNAERILRMAQPLPDNVIDIRERAKKGSV